MQQKGGVVQFLAAEAKYSDYKQNAKAVVTEKFTDSAKASMWNRRLIQSNGDWKSMTYKLVKTCSLQVFYYA